MNLYQQTLASHLLSSTHKMIDHLAQPQMFGGKRTRKWILTGENDYAYPATLAVGTHGYQKRTLGGAYFGDEMGAEDDRRDESESDEEPEMEGGKKKYSVKNFITDVNSLGKLVPKSTRGAITAKADEKIAGLGRKPRGRPRKIMPDEYLEGIASGGALTSRVHRGVDNSASYPPALASYDGTFGGKVVGNKHTAQAQIIRAFGGKQKPLQHLDIAQFNYGREHPTKAKLNMKKPKSAEPVAMEGGKKKYSVKNFITDVNSLGKLIPKSTRETATAKANQQIAGAGMEGGKKKYGVKSFINDVNSLGRLIPKSTRETATAKADQKIAGLGRGRPVSERGKIVKQVMQEMGLSLGQASKYVKEKGLY